MPDVRKPVVLWAEFRWFLGILDKFRSLKPKIDHKVSVHFNNNQRKL
jgi:hypothetical protein